MTSEFWKKLSSSQQNRIRSELLRLAFSNNSANLLVNGLASISVLVFFDLKNLWLWIWLLLVVAISMARWALAMAFSKHCNDGVLTEQNRLYWQRLFGGGLLLGALMWVVLVWTTINGSSLVERYDVFIVVSALAAGATGVLAPLLNMGRVYIGLMLVPPSLCLFLIVTPQPVLGFLGLAFFSVMLVSHYHNHSVLVRSLILQEENRDLVDKLRTHNQEMLELNASLEKKVEERTHVLQNIASHDFLTGLYNRRGLQKWIGERISASPLEEMTVLFLDLDRFKQINDGFGHDLGDKVLEAVARRFAAILPENVAIARWGGDEFVVIVPKDYSEEGLALRLADELRNEMSKLLPIEHLLATVGVSVGVANYPNDATTLTDLIRSADLAVSEAKRLGRGNVQVYKESLSIDKKRKLQIGFALRNATVDGSFSLAFQPIVDVVSGQVVSQEVLSRWCHPTLGNIAPNEFIPIAEDSEHINMLGAWVLAHACSSAMGWGSLPQDTAVAVNVSVRQLLSKRFIDVVCQVLELSGLPANRLHIEVTESVFGENLDSLDVLSALRRLGVETHIDDFGTGYSSLSRLHELPVDALKLDRSFIEDIHGQGRVIVEGVVLMAQSFGLDVIAEGVETLEQAKILHALGVQKFQGYFFKVPDSVPTNVSFDTQWQTLS